MPRQAHLRRLLEDFVPANEREQRHQARILQLIADTEAPFSRAQYAPGHVTASAFVTTPDRRALLLILHSKLQLWLQPGGHVEADDSDVLASARREVLEEVGLSELELASPGLFDVDVHDIPARKDQPAHEHFDVRFLFTTRRSEATAGSDAMAARWVPVSELLRATSDGPYHSDESVMRAVRKLHEVS
ncbi:MAG TPA: NUDIX domain-containing protein [Polyangiales bacterium]|nr:NUDIX domain-containing protein [Polyangiales bacterium]